MSAKALLLSGVLAGAEGQFPKWLTYIAGKAVLVVGDISQFLFMSTSTKDCLSIHVPWQLSFPRASDERKRERASYPL